MVKFGYGFSYNALAGGGVIPKPITDATIIATITDDANWDGDGNYTGSTTGLLNGNYYYDSTYNQKYEYNGTTLVRFTYNTLID